MMNRIPTIDGTLKFSKIDQVGVVVKDLDAAMKYYTSFFGMGPFRVIESAFTDMTLYGKPADFKIRMAFAEMGVVSLELIQVVKGPTIYEDFLASRGEGLHHLGCYIDNMDDALQKCRQAGINILQSGSAGKVKFAYLDTENIGGVILELIQR